MQRWWCITCVTLVAQKDRAKQGQIETQGALRKTSSVNMLTSEGQQFDITINQICVRVGRALGVVKYLWLAAKRCLCQTKHASLHHALVAQESSFKARKKFPVLGTPSGHR